MADPRAKVIIDGDGSGAVRAAQQVAKAYERLNTDMDDAFSKGIGRAGSNLASMAEDLGGAFAALTNPAAAIGLGLVPATGMVINFGKKASSVATVVEKSMADVWTLLNIGKDELGGLGDKVGEIALDMRRPPEMIAQALYEWISANGRIDDDLQEFRTSLKAAVAGSTEAKVAVSGITNILNAYGDAAGGAARVSDLMFQTVNKGKIRFNELSEGIGTVISTAQGASVPLEELMAAIATATAKGIRPASAMEGIRSAISNIIKPSEQATETAKILGIQWGAQALKAKGLAGLLTDVRKATKGNVETMAQLFGDVSGLNVVLALSAENADMFSSNLALMQDSAGATDEAFRKQRDTMFEASQGADTLGQSLLKVFGDEINERMKPFFDTMNANAPAIIGYAEALAKQFGSWLDKPWETLDRIPSVIGNWAGSTSNLYKAYTDLADGNFLSFLQDVGKASLSLVGAPWQAWVSGFGLLKRSAGDLGSMQGAFVSWLEELPGKMENGANGLTAWLKGKGPDWAGAAVDWTDKALADTKAWFEGLGGNIAGSVTTAYTWLTTEIPKWGGAFGQWLNDADTSTKQWFTDFGARTADSVGAAAGWLLVKIPEWKGAFVTWLDNSLTATKDWFTNLPDQIADGIAGVGKWLSTEVPAKWTAFQDWLNGFGEDAETFFTDLPGKVTTWLNGVVDSIPGLYDSFKAKGVALAESIWDGMKASITGYFDGAKRTAADILENFNSGFKRGQNAATGNTGIPAGIGDFFSGVPKHGVGGVFGAPHLAWIAERGETEAVVPESRAADFLPLILEWAGMGRNRVGMPSMAFAGGMGGMSMGGVTVIINGGPATDNPQAWGRAAGNAAGDALYDRLANMIKL